MTRDDIIRMAREAGFPVKKWDDGIDEVMEGDNYHIQTDQVIDFAALVAAAEREACAQMAGNYAAANAESDNMAWAFLHLATAIRARGEK